MKNGQNIKIIKKENSNLDEIAEIISSDPPLSAKVLRLINSALYMPPAKVTTVPRAVNMLGLDAVKNIALSFSMIKIFFEWFGQQFPTKHQGVGGRIEFVAQTFVAQTPLSDSLWARNKCP